MCNYLKLKTNNGALQGVNEVLTLESRDAVQAVGPVGIVLKIEPESFAS